MTRGLALEDDAFLAELEAGRPRGGAFRHLDHLRLTWLWSAPRRAGGGR
jgi:hypothetical protein